jgi:hypothetical protein
LERGVSVDFTPFDKMAEVLKVYQNTVSAVQFQLSRWKDLPPSSSLIAVKPDVTTLTPLITPLATPPIHSKGLGLLNM